MGMSAHRGDGFQSLAFVHGILNMVENHVVVHTDDHLHLCPVAAIDNVLGRELVGGGDTFGAQLHQSHHAHPHFRALLQNEHHHVALFNAMGGEHVGRLVAVTLHVPEGEALHVPCVIGPHQRWLLRVQPCPFVHNVIGEIEVLRDIAGIVFIKVLIRIELGTRTVPL